MKYQIINEEKKQIACKRKTNGGSHYPQPMGNIEVGLIIVETTKGRAESECKFFNKEYGTGWIIRGIEED